MIYLIVILNFLFFVIWWNIYHRRREGYDGKMELQPYVINLKKNQQRYSDFMYSYQQSDLNESNVIRIEAVYGKEIPYHNYISKQPEAILTPGMVGCFLSHLETYRQFLNSSATYALIFEDDARIHRNIRRDFISTIQEKIPADWDIVLLGYFNQDPTHKYEIHGSYVKFYHFWGTHGYIVNRKSAQKLLDSMQPPFTNQIDHVMGKLARENKLNIYGLKETSVIQDSAFTDVQPNTK